MDEKKTDLKAKKTSTRKNEYDNGTEKTNSTRSDSTMGSRKKAKKQEWEKYFCYINDKDREQMLKLPDLPVKKLMKPKRKIRRSKSAGYTKSTESKIPAQNKNENNKNKIKVNNEVEKKPIASPFSAPRTNKIKKIEIVKTNDSNLSDSMNSLNIKPTYKYLMRSMKANLDQYLKIKEYTTRSNINTQDYLDHCYRTRINAYP